MQQGPPQNLDSLRQRIAIGDIEHVRRLAKERGLSDRLAAPAQVLTARLSPRGVRFVDDLRSPAQPTVVDVLQLFAGGIFRARVPQPLRAELVAALVDTLFAAPPPTAPARTPRDPAGLVETASRLGMDYLLEVDLGTLGAQIDPMATYVLLRQPRRFTLRDVLHDPGGSRGEVSSLLSEGVFERVQRVVMGAVTTRIERAKTLFAEENERAARRGTPHPSLAAFAQQIAAARAEVRRRALPLPAALTDGLRMHFLARPPSIVIAAGHGPAVESVTIPLEGYPDEPPRASCRCGRAGCQNVLAALDLLLDWLHRLAPASNTELFRFLSLPPWQRALDALDETLASAPGDAAGDAQRIVFRLHGDGAELRLEPSLQKRLKAGGWSSGSRLTSLPDEETCLNLDAVEGILYLLDGGGGGLRATYRALERLIDSEYVFLAEQRVRPLAIRRGALGLAAIRQPQGGLLLTPAVDGSTLSPEAWAGVFDEGLLIHVDPGRNECVIARVDLKRAALLEVFGEGSALFPASAEPDLVARLGALEAHLPLTLPDELAGASLPGDERIVLRLTPLPSGLEGEAFLRPLDGGALFPPGVGPLRISGLRSGDRVHVQRDFAAEVAHSRARIDRLPLHRATFAGPFAFALASDDDALDLLAHLRGCDDVIVEWPAGKTGRAVIGTATPAGLRVAIRDHKDWFGLEGAVDVAGEAVPLALLLEAVRGGRRYVRLSESRFAAISDELRDRLGAAADVIFSGRRGLEASPAGAPALLALTDGAVEARVCASFRLWIDRLAAARASDPELPAGLRAELRPYQIDGFRWLHRLSEWGVGGCLADDMGLGKTLQALALLLTRAPRGPSLVVAPTSVCFNWVRETERFAPLLRPALYRESDRATVLASLGPNDLLIASYGLVVRHAKELAAHSFATLVLDESQAIKNAQTRRARAVRDLDAEWRVALTGTPIENHLGELWSLFRTVAPGLLGSWEQFRERFAVPIERDRDPARRKALARLVRPFILRRSKAEVAPELPARTEIRRPIILSAPERQNYEEARLAIVAALAAGASNGGLRPPEQRRFQVLAAITRLRQLACNPRLFDPDSRAPSAKLDSFLELVDELRENGHRALVFSQFTSHLALVRRALDERTIPYLYLDGQTPAADREKRVDAFQRGEGDLFLISLKAGGTGLNLTAADYVVHLDPWWNPAVEDQATDRAHRIGQTRPVTVYRLISAGTIEEAILSLHERKRDLVAGLLDGSDAAGKLSTDELVDLIRLGAAGAEPPEEGGEGEDDPAPAPARRGKSSK